MSKRKIFLIIGILILLISVPGAIFVLKQQAIFKLGAQTTNKPENVKVSNITEQTATITWTTQKATQGVISYGLSATNLTLVQPESTPAINHQVTLNNLLPENTYFFVIKISDKAFDNSGQPFTFTTKAKELTPSPTSTPPTPALIPSLTEEDFQSVMGTSNPTYDLNKDGIVNTFDLLLFRQQQNK